jgi:release factor glutamine methyltransferase
VEDGRLDAELLLAHILEVDRLELYLQYDRPLQPRELKAFKSVLRRRAAREPLQYVVGQTAFRELDLRTDRRALIPRPETEVLVGEVLAWAHGQASFPGPSLVAMDLGTGAGAIALSLLKEGPFAHVVATDISLDALSLASENARALGLSEGLELRDGAFFDPLDESERFHVVVSNPPYVPEADRSCLAPEVGVWEPLEALMAGPDGLAVLDPLTAQAPAYLHPGGLLALEVGDGQAVKVAELLAGTESFREVRVVQDLARRDRIVTATRR